MACLLRLLVITFLVALPAKADDQMVLGPRQFQRDSGAGAVLCVWSVYLTLQSTTAACGLVRRPSDDAIDRAIADMDEFILANSSLHPTRSMLEDFKRRAKESELKMLRQTGLQKFCEGSTLEHFRGVSPGRIEAEIKELLAIPREPVMNPCL